MRGTNRYVEADYFGGVGTQFGALWRGQARSRPDDLDRGRTPGCPCGVSDFPALRELGVSAAGHFDEFDTRRGSANTGRTGDR